MNEFKKETYYNIYSPEDKEPILVYCWFNEDAGCLGLSYFQCHGGAFMPCWDFREDCKAVEVELTEV